MVRIGDLLGNIFGAAGAEDGVPARVLNEVRPWTSELLQSAMRSWLPRIASGTLCEIPARRNGRVVGECHRFGVSTCVVCTRPTCLEHGLVSSAGEIICGECAVLAQEVVPPVRRERARRAEQEPPKRTQRERSQERADQRRAQQPPPGGGGGAKRPAPRPEDVLAARAILGVGMDASWADVLAAHRKLSGKWHPDRWRQKSRREQQTAEENYLNVQKARDFLKKVYPEAA